MLCTTGAPPGGTPTRGGATTSRTRLSPSPMGNGLALAKSELFKTLRKSGVRKSVARAVAAAEHGGKDAEAIGREALADLTKASKAIRSRVTEPAARGRAGRKGAAARKRKAAQRSEAAKQAARTRKATAKSR